MKVIHILPLFIFALVATKALSEETSSDRPSGVSESDWIPITKDLGLYSYKTVQQPVDNSIIQIKALEKQMETIQNDPKQQEKREFLSKKIDELRRNPVVTPGLVESVLMTRKDGKWYLVKTPDLERQSLFHYIQENTR